MPRTASPKQVPHVVRLKPNALDEQIARQGLRFRSELCRRAGIVRSTLERVIADGKTPGGQFIAGVLVALPEAAFDDLFEVVPRGRT